MTECCHGSQRTKATASSQYRNCLRDGAKGVSRTPAGDAFSGLVVQVFRLNGLFTAAGDEMARPAGQTSARWQVLAAADHAPMTVAQIARALNLARQSVQRVADLLVGDEASAAYMEAEDTGAEVRRSPAGGPKEVRSIQGRPAHLADEIGRAGRRSGEFSRPARHWTGPFAPRARIGATAALTRTATEPTSPDRTVLLRTGAQRAGPRGTSDTAHPDYRTADPAGPATYRGDHTGRSPGEPRSSRIACRLA